MGVSWVLTVPVGGQQTTQQVIESIQHKLEALNAKRSGIYEVELETLVHNHEKKSLNILQHSDFPLSSFAISDSDTCVIGDASLSNLLTQSLSQFYSSRKVDAGKSKIEVKGSRYRVSDFVVHIGSAMCGGSTRGVVLEVEYSPCCFTVACMSLLQEFISGLLGESTERIGAHPLSRKADHTAQTAYSARHTAQQYLDVLRDLRKAPQSSTMGGSASSTPHHPGTPQSVK